VPQTPVEHGACAGQGEEAVELIKQWGDGEASVRVKISGGPRRSMAAGEVPCGSRRKRVSEGGRQSRRRRARRGAHRRGVNDGAFR
jgi:hypothetical protein